MKQGSFWNRSAAAALVLSAVAIVGLVYLLSPPADDELPGPRAGREGAFPGAASAPRPAAAPQSSRTDDAGAEPAAPRGDVELTGPPLLRGVVSGEGAPIEGASVHLVPAAYVERILARVSDSALSGGDFPDIEKIVRIVIDGVDAVRRAAHVAKTDERGVYEFRGIAPREYVVLTIADGWIFRYGDVVGLAAGETRELNPALERGASISGRVVNSRGEGVGGVPVVARARAAGSSGMGLVFARLIEYADGTVLRGPYETTTTADGAFSIASLAPGTYDLEARGPSGLRVEIESVATGSADTLIYLGEPAWVDGTVVDPGGAPVEGVPIEMEKIQGAPMVPMMAMGLGATADILDRGLGGGPRAVETDAAGRFRLGPFAPGDYRLSIVARDLRSLQQSFSLSWGEEKALGEVRVDPGRRIAGRVLSAGGEATAGATVTVTPAEVDFLRMAAVLQDTVSGRNRVESGPDGGFELGGLAPGQYRVSARAPGWSPGGVKTEAGDEECEIRLEPGVRVAGVVTDASSGSPVRATVRAGSLQTETDAEGRFALDGVAAIDPNDPNNGPPVGIRPVPMNPDRKERRLATLMVTAEGYSSSRVTLDLSRGENVADVRLRPARQISGRVLGPSGDPVAGSLVRVILAERNLSSSFMDPSLLSLSAAVSDAEGRFRLKSFREFVPNSWYQVLADHPEFARGESERFQLDSDESYEIDLSLVEPAVVRGVVTDGTRPIPGAAVRLKRFDKAERGAQSEITMRMFGFPRGGTPAYTDGDGRFSYRRVAPGDYVINADVPGFGSASELEIRVERGREIDLELLVDTGEEIRGMVFDTEGNSLEGALVKLVREPSAADGGNRIELRALQRLMGAAFRSTRVNEEGEFVFDGVPEGRYTVVAEAKGYAGAELTDVAAGETEIEIVLAAGAGLVGRVVDAATGDPVTDFTLFTVPVGQESDPFAIQSLMGRGEGSERNHPEGRFSRSDLLAGAYRVSVTATGYLPVTTRVELTAGRVLERDFELVRGARIQGTVLDGKTRRPVAGASIGMKEGAPPSSAGSPDAGDASERGANAGEPTGDWLKELWRSRNARTDSSGRFLIDGVPEGVVTIGVEHNDYVSEARELRDVGLGEERTIVIELTSGLSFSGRAVTEAGEAFASRFFFLSGASPEIRGVSKSAVTSATGRFRISGLKPGRYSVHVPPTGGETPEATDVGEVDLRENVSDYVLRVPVR